MVLFPMATQKSLLANMGRQYITCRQTTDMALDSAFMQQHTVGWGLTSHSAIFQLYSDGTVVQFPPAAGHPTPWAARGL